MFLKKCLTGALTLDPAVVMKKGCDEDEKQMSFLYQIPIHCSVQQRPAIYGGGST